MSLSGKAVAGAQWTTLSMVGVTAIQVASLLILARIILPSDFGLVAIMMVVIGFGRAFADMGISNAIIHKQDITHTQLSSLYWLNLMSGLVLTIIVAAISPLVAQFYDDTRFTSMMLLSSTVFFIVSVGNQYRVLCQKELQFRLSAVIEVTSSLLSFGVAIGFALAGFGAYALIFALLAEAIVSSALFLYVGLREHHRPALNFNHRDVREFYSFGLFQMGERSINHLGANIDKLLIGNILGLQALGFYNVAWQLIMLPLSKINPVVNRVAFPVYAKIQNDRESLGRYYTFSIRFLSTVTVPLLAFLHVYSKEIVSIALGPGWEPTASLVGILALVGTLKALGNPGGALLLALGRADIGFWWNAIWAPLAAAAIMFALFLAPQVETVAYALLVLSLTASMIWHYIIARVAQINHAVIVRHFFNIIVVSYALCWGSFLFIQSLPFQNPVARFLIGILLCCIGYATYLLLSERELVAQIRRLTKDNV